MDLKLVVLFTVILVASAIEKLPADQEDLIVENYFQTYPNTRYGRSSRRNTVRQNILKHYYEVQEHNSRYRQGNESFEMELNEFSVSNAEDLARTKLGFSEPEVEEEEKVQQAHVSELPDLLNTASSKLPDYFNWADHGVVQPVQNQGDCGSCYAFAAIGVLESSMCLYHGNCVKLSEQEAMECTNGCRGGWDTQVYNYANQKGGCTLAAYYRYLGLVQNSCDTTIHRSRVEKSQVYQHKILPNDSEAIRQFLYHYGPLFVAYDVYENFFSYRNGILSTISGSRVGGHAVLLTGYGTSTDGIPYWILKNSWGSRWGERGYFRVIRGVNYARIESWKVSYAWTK